MKKHITYKKIFFAACFILSLCNLLHAQSFEPVVGSNYYYLTSRDWKLSVIEHDTVSIPIDNPDVFTLMFFVGIPIGSPNSLMISQNDTLSDPVEYEFVTPAQNQIVLAPGTSNQQIWTIDYIDADIFIYLTSITINGTLYNYRFKMVSI